jgi:hypothetical protein
MICFSEVTIYGNPNKSLNDVLVALEKVINDINYVHEKINSIEKMIKEENEK